MPLDSSSFDLIVSQFGLEYAGFEAIDEVMRLLDHGGRLALLLHHQNGGIYRQCAASLDAIDSMLDARFIPLAIDMFQAGFRAYESDDIADYEAKMKDFVPALRTMESVMRRHGQDVADGTIIRLYKDVRTIHGKLRNYDPAEVIGWLKRLEDEVRAYAGRVASMCEAALDEDAFRAWCQRLEHHGLRPDRADAIFAGDRMVPLAWALVGNKA